MSTTYELMIKIVNAGKKTKDEMLSMCDVFFAAGRLSSTEYETLVKEINDMQ